MLFNSAQTVLLLTQGGPGTSTTTLSYLVYRKAFVETDLGYSQAVGLILFVLGLLGMAGADLLGTLLQRHPDDVGAALAEWEARLRPYVEGQQESALTDRLLFVAGDEREHALRTGMMSGAAGGSGAQALVGFAEKNRDIAAP